MTVVVPALVSISWHGNSLVVLNGDFCVGIEVIGNHDTVMPVSNHLTSVVVPREVIVFNSVPRFCFIFVRMLNNCYRVSYTLLLDTFSELTFIGFCSFVNVNPRISYL